MPPPLVLASTSPQRRALLAQLGFAFRVEAPAYDERALPLEAAELVARHAVEKARSVRPRPGDGPVLGVDTDVVLDGEVLGKPGDADEAAAMLARLEGRAHLVVSGLAVIADGREVVGRATTVVRFRAASRDEVEAYVACGEWQGRAGAYAIQERGALLVESVEGDYANVVGLPVALLVRSLQEVRYPVLAAPARADG
jgi:nucleoside triphosphate pyrophosphatase